jgi:signal peptidase
LAIKIIKLLKTSNFQTAISIALVVLIILGLYLAESKGYVAEVPSQSMSIGGYVDTAWMHPFDRTLQIGDILIIQPIDPKNLNANYPNSDIIVYQNPLDPKPDLIVHRIAAKEEINGTLYFFTKGDGNPINKWPNSISPSEYDPWSPVPQNLVVGKVILRVPWIGFVSMFMQKILGGNSRYIIIPIIVIIVLLIVIFEFVLPLFKRKTSFEANSNEGTKT